MQVLLVLMSIGLVICSALDANKTLTGCDINQPLPKDTSSWTCQTGCTCTYTQYNEDSMCGSITVNDGAHATVVCNAKKSCQAGCAVSTVGSGTATVKCGGEGSCYAAGYSGNTDVQCSGANSCYAIGCRDPAHAECTGSNACDAAGCSH